MPQGIVKYHRLRNMPGMLSNTEGEAGGGTPPATPPAEQPAAPADPPGNPDELGDKGKQAIDRMKAERTEAVKQAKELQAQLDKLRESTQSEQEKALAAARKEGETAARASTLPKLVAAEFKAAAAGRMTSEQLAGFIEDLDLTKYLTDDGEVDAERVANKVDLLAPPSEPRVPSFNGGARTPETKRASSLGEAIANRMAKKP